MGQRFSFSKHPQDPASIQPLAEPFLLRMPDETPASFLDLCEDIHCQIADYLSYTDKQAFLLINKKHAALRNFVSCSLSTTYRQYFLAYQALIKSLPEDTLDLLKSEFILGSPLSGEALLIPYPLERQSTAGQSMTRAQWIDWFLHNQPDVTALTCETQLSADMQNTPPASVEISWSHASLSADALSALIKESKTDAFRDRNHRNIDRYALKELKALCYLHGMTKAYRDIAIHTAFIFFFFLSVGAATLYTMKPDLLSAGVALLLPILLQVPSLFFLKTIASSDYSLKKIAGAYTCSMINIDYDDVGIRMGIKLSGLKLVISAASILIQIPISALLFIALNKSPAVIDIYASSIFGLGMLYALHRYRFYTHRKIPQQAVLCVESYAQSTEEMVVVSEKTMRALTDLLATQDRTKVSREMTTALKTTVSRLMEPARDPHPRGFY